MNIIVSTNGPHETEQTGQLLAAYLKPGDCISLTGEMGSGKTCFVRGVGCGLKVPNNYQVNSPSYTLINRYPGTIPLYHADLYRLETSAELNDLELHEIIHGDGVTFIEWPHLILPQIHFSMSINFHWDMTSETKRTIEFSTKSAHFHSFIEELKNAHTRN